MAEMQEFVFYLGDRSLGSFFMTAEGTVKPEPIPRRMVIPPTKTSVGGHPALLWVEQIDGDIETRIWPADTPAEVAESERLYDAAHGNAGADDDAAREFQPVMRTPEEQRLLQAVRDDFENDAVLLSYADWLTSQGSGQGEFIRVDLEMQRTSPDDSRYEELEQRWGELLAEHGETWYQPLTALDVFPYERSFWLERGVIAEVEINRPSLLTARAAELFDAVPLLRKLSFDCEEFDVAELTQIPQLSQIRSLELSYLNIEPSQLDVFLKSPYLNNLVELDLHGNDAGTELVQGVVESPVLTQLQLLSLSDCEINDEGLELIADGETPLALKTLELDGNEISKDGLKALGRSCRFQQLTSLSLGDMKLNAAGIAALGKGKWVPQLETLSFKSSKINSSVAAKLLTWPTGRLRKLDLSSCGLKDPELMMLLNSPLLANIEELDLNYNKLTDDGIQALAQSPVAAKLKTLELNANRFGSKGIAALANSPFLSGLRTLNVCNVKLGSDGVEALATSSCLQKITWLVIGDENEISDSDREKLMARYGESNVMF